MRALLRSGLAPGLVLFALGAGALDTNVLPDPALQARYVVLTHELRCMQCQNESIADSPVDLARICATRCASSCSPANPTMRSAAGWRRATGTSSCFRPRYSWRNAWLWGAPAALLLLGAVVCWRILRKRTQLLVSDLDPVEEDPRI